MDFKTGGSMMSSLIGTDCPTALHLIFSEDFEDDEVLNLVLSTTPNQSLKLGALNPLKEKDLCPATDRNAKSDSQARTPAS